MQAEKQTKKVGKAAGAEGIKRRVIKKAKRTAIATRAGNGKRVYKIRSKPRFYRPRTLVTKKAPKYTRHAANDVHDKNEFDKYSVLLNPLATEKAMRKMETENTLVYIVNSKASKHQIKEAFKQVHNIVPRKINTLLR